MRVHDCPYRVVNSGHMQISFEAKTIRSFYDSCFVEGSLARILVSVQDTCSLTKRKLQLIPSMSNPHANHRYKTRLPSSIPEGNTLQNIYFLWATAKKTVSAAD